MSVLEYRRERIAATRHCLCAGIGCRHPQDFDVKSVSVVTKLAGESLLNKNGRPDEKTLSSAELKRVIARLISQAS